MFDELHDWLMLGNSIDEAVNMVDDRAFGLATNFVIAISDDLENFDLYDVYNCFSISHGGNLNVTFYAYWNFENGMTVNLTQSKFARRSNLHGLKLKAMYFQVSRENLTRYK